MGKTTDKPWQYDRPFTRVNSKQVAAATASGLGFSCGCRKEGINFGTLDSPLINLAMKNIPSWVPVLDEEPRELEGTLLRSFQTWTDTPVFQFHRWYDWNFHVQPDGKYEYLCGPANHINMSDINSSDGWQPLFDPNVKIMECEWDTEGFGKRRWGPMFESGGAWPWPMTGERIWLSGRWIYDCGHPTDNFTRSELHPCMAIAFARWEAFRFESNEFAVPAIQFVFFVSRLGGYHDFRSITDTDYEFVVDLPKVGAPARTWPIGHTPEVGMNSVVLPGYPLQKFDSTPFRTEARVGSNGFFAGQEDLRPTVELIQPKDPQNPPIQASITIPLTKLKAEEQKRGRKLDAYGVITSLGWSDPGNVQARRVRKCTVAFQEISFLENEHPTGGLRNNPIVRLLTHVRRRKEGDSVIKIGLNGRWFTQFLSTVKAPKRFSLQGGPFVFHLSEDDFIRFNAHGCSFTEPGIGDFMNKNSDAQRVLRMEDGTVVDYERDVVDGNGPSGRTRVIFDPGLGGPPTTLQTTVWQEAFIALVDSLKDTFAFENDPLGVIDPGLSVAPQPFPNPVPIRTWNPAFNGQVRRLRGFRTMDDGELQQHPGHLEYELVFSIKVERQL